MSGDLVLLEKKFDQFIAFCEGLNAENRALRARVAKMEEERLALLAKIESARTRLEALMDKLPAEVE
jgi:cell division protein ZapB